LNVNPFPLKTACMLDPDQLLRVAKAYARATGTSLVTVGRWSCTNDKIYLRLAEGHGALSKTIERATLWFQHNWPRDARWPPELPALKQPRQRRSLRQSCAGGAA
jgi:hypothetical protein